MPRGTYTWADVKNLIQDRMRSAAFISDNTEEIRRAFNSGLDKINAGDTGINQPLSIAFDFQKEETDISFVAGTIDYTFATLSITEETFKFPADHGLRIDSEEDVYFTYRTPEYFARKVGVRSSSEKMFAFFYDGNDKTMKINNFTTETLNFWFYTNAMVLDNDGTTRRAYVDGNSDSDTFLFPDRFVNVAVNFAVAELYGIKKGFLDPESQGYMQEAQRGLRGMINSVGANEVQPVISAKIRSEQRRGINRISRH